MVFRVSKRAHRALKHAILVGLDAAVIAVSLFLSLSLRMNGDIPPHMFSGLVSALPVQVVVFICVFHAAGLYRRLWRFVSLVDLCAVAQAVTVAIALSHAVPFLVGPPNTLPTSVPLIQWFIAIFLVACVRIARRSFPSAFYSALKVLKGNPNRPRSRTLIAGPAEQAEIVLRQLEAEAAPRFQPVGILDTTDFDVSRRLRNVAILGAFDALESVVEALAAKGRRPESLILAPGNGSLAETQIVDLAKRAKALGLRVTRAFPSPATDQNRPYELALQPVDMSDLLERPESVIDARSIARVVAGRRMLVTGAGGTIGSELVRQIAAFEPSQLILLDSSEFNLYKIAQELDESFPTCRKVAVICSICDRDHVMNVFAEHKPDFVFHAAALKHVPLVEENPCAGVRTNVLGTRNVADAAMRYQCRAFVQVSTDKAVHPVGIMGATKCLGELYCQALDLAGADLPESPRFLTVRFGNVLGSSGSLIPLFQRQLSRRKPLTVTHPDVERYFMTCQEAVKLILRSLQSALEYDARRGRIFVLDMGEPVKILDIARRMIRLSGLEPGLDVNIEIVGLRPGEKLYEELFDEGERRIPSAVRGVFEAEPNPVSLNVLNRAFDRLDMASLHSDVEAVRAEISRVVSMKHDKDAPGRARQPSAVAAGSDSAYLEQKLSAIP